MIAYEDSCMYPVFGLKQSESFLLNAQLKVDAVGIQLSSAGVYVQSYVSIQH